MSSKQDSGKLHGIGLQNVEDQARAYMGALNIQAANGLFHAVVMLQKPAKIENKEEAQKRREAMLGEEEQGYLAGVSAAELLSVVM